MKSSVIKRALVRQAFGGALLHRSGAIESSFAGHDHPLADVAEHRVGGAAERTPGARTARPLALLPDELASQEQTEIVLEDADHVGRQAAVRLAAEVGDVDRDPPAGLELADATRRRHRSASRGTRDTTTAHRRARAPLRTACRRSTAARSRRARPSRRPRDPCDGRRRVRTARRPARAAARRCRRTARATGTVRRTASRRDSRVHRHRSWRSSSSSLFHHPSARATPKPRRVRRARPNIRAPAR